MKLSIDTASEFRNQFIAYNRDNFTCQGYELLFEHFEDIDPDMVLDVIAVCCEYSEDTFEQIAANYEFDLTGVDEADIPQAIMDFLCDNTTVVGETSTGFVYAIF